MYQIKLTDEQYRDLYFALGIAKEATRIEALNVDALGLKGIVNEISEEANKYKALQMYIVNNREVL